MKYLKFLKNWRIVALTVMAMAAFLLIISESENVVAVVATKFIGFTVGFFAYRIGKDWYKKGLMDEINEFNDNEDE